MRALMAAMQLKKWRTIVVDVCAGDGDTADEVCIWHLQHRVFERLCLLNIRLLWGSGGPLCDGGGIATHLLLFACRYIINKVYPTNLSRISHASR
jgi:hypothetical protein